MTYHNLWGIHPVTKKPSAYIGHVNHTEKTEWEKKAKTEGWTRLTWGKWEATDADKEASEEKEGT